VISTERIRVPCPLCDGGKGVRERTLNGFDLTRCRRCGFVFVNPRPGDSDLSRLYTNRDAGKLIELYSQIGSPSMIEAYNRKLDWLERLAPSRGRLLDFACAAGYFFEQALKRGWDAHGADIGEWTLQAARARGLCNLHVGRLQDLGFPDHHFDVIYAAQVFEHLPSPREDLAELHRILRPGGLLYIDVPNYNTVPILLNRDDFILNRPPQHINYFTPRTLRRLLRSAPFADVRISSSDGLKWENLIGRRFESELTKAYGIGGSVAKAVPSRTHSHPGRLALWLLKKAVVATVIKPLFYDGLKVGMNLVGLARRL
jgi:2-polyprenyl-3-methyl-5-hydroxy-6-metoxy-1,4-benzoquinol methylase